VSDRRPAGNSIRHVTAERGELEAEPMVSVVAKRVHPARGLGCASIAELLDL
jgi:hypothetical protein